MGNSFNGSCLCGSIRYQVNGDILDPGMCHCSMCQKAHGAPFGVYSAVRWDDFELLCGEETLARYASSENVTRTFCNQCGATLQFIREGRPSFGLAIATLDTPFDKPLDIQIFTRYKAPWWPLSSEPQCFEEVPEKA